MNIFKIILLAAICTTTSAQSAPPPGGEKEFNKMRIDVANSQKKKLCPGLKEPAFVKEQGKFYTNIRKKFNFFSDWDFSRHAIFVDKNQWEQLSREERQLIIAPIYTHALCFTKWDEEGPTAHVINKDGGFILSVDRYKPEGFREDYARLFN